MAEEVAEQDAGDVSGVRALAGLEGPLEPVPGGLQDTLVRPVSAIAVNTPRCLGGITRPVRRKIALDLVRHRAQRIGRERNGPSVGVEQGFIGHVAASYGERIKMITPEAADTVPRRRRATGADRCR
ncbi:hypothetical protein [Actinomadura madurae]|uniref:hypothetical protein n=1 Tax=Actinomadura madurae TaxID=1993 RepID=UPI0020270753|nr:hypothetical protein [Actinomadura madurae]MCP9949511.1 hypothetical protein [Actinomadura madurae]MCP9966266.1 hypothetical protein [Actinomadura madurae]MCP9978758.1 hypothetical protein [Actinomadura madurae]MCQ0009723.1 hypothetical protein [Actinomadura madurae]MCQ0014948.1 hypothetical protein [Actinomadura madurae]